MIFKNIDELPSNIKTYLPINAQKIYRIAYNNAWERYENDPGNNSKNQRRIFAERVAWHTIKHKYEKVM